jgi:spoIIIJ-associated protein
MSEHEMTATEATAGGDEEAQDEGGGEESSAPKQHVSLAEKVAIAQETATKLFELLGANKPTVECRADDDQVIVQLTDLDPALQPQGDTRVLESMQFILNKAINRFSLDRTRLSLDADGFRRRRPEGLDKVATALAEKSKQLGKSLAIGPLGQGDLRFLTAQLSRTPGLALVHHGAPERRRLVIAPKTLVAALPQGDAPREHENGTEEGHGGGHRRRRRRR